MGRLPRQLFRQNQDDTDFVLQNARRDDGNVQGKAVLYFGRCLLVSRENIEKIAVSLMKLDAGEQPIEGRGAHDESHAGGDRLILDLRELQFSTLPWPPSGWWVIGGYFRRPQRHQVAALIRVAPDLRGILASHVTLQFVDRCRLRPTDNIQR